MSTWTSPGGAGKPGETTLALTFAQEAERLLAGENACPVQAYVIHHRDDIQGVTVTRGEEVVFESPRVRVECVRVTGNFSILYEADLPGVRDEAVDYVVLTATVEAPPERHAELTALWGRVFR